MQDHVVALVVSRSRMGTLFPVGVHLVLVLVVVAGVVAAIAASVRYRVQQVSSVLCCVSTWWVSMSSCHVASRAATDATL